MQRATPPGASQQQQALTRIMPLISIFWGFIVPSGVILYWTTSNLVQIGQQYFLLRAGHIGQPSAASDGAKRQAPPQRGDGGGRAGSPRERPAPAGRKGFFASMLERAEADRTRRQAQAGTPRGGDPPQASDRQPRPQSPSQQRPGGSGARSRKKRRKR